MATGGGTAPKLQSRLQSQTEEMLEEVEYTKLRPMRKEAFLNMAKCCDGPLSREAFQGCLQRAGHAEERAQGVLQQEVNIFQDRLQRAVAACQDEVRDRGLTNQDRISAHFDRCLCKVLDKHIAMVPTIQKRILQSIDAIANAPK